MGEAFGPTSNSQCAVNAIKYYSRTNEKDVAAKREYIFHGEFQKVFLSPSISKRDFISLISSGISYPNMGMSFQMWLQMLGLSYGIWIARPEK
ncbi:MAG: hypothetical protein ABL927_08330 [Bdellovibrionales bacterium]